MTEPAADRRVAPIVLDTLDYVWSRFRARIDGLTQDEYVWEPAPGAWSVRAGDDGRWRIERVVPDPHPAPVTTIAWRLWHIGAECLAGYTSNGLGDWPLLVTGREWYADVGPALGALDTAWSAFRQGLDGLGEDGMWRKLGPDWGPYADDTWAALALHALDELAHHGAEVALLRDLYARRGS
jgi:DinB superfamily